MTTEDLNNGPQFTAHVFSKVIIYNAFDQYSCRHYCTCMCTHERRLYTQRQMVTFPNSVKINSRLDDHRSVILISPLDKHIHARSLPLCSCLLRRRGESVWNNDMCECCGGQRSIVINSDTMATGRELFPPSPPDLLFQDQDVRRTPVRVWPSGVSVVLPSALETGCIPWAYSPPWGQKSRKTLTVSYGSCRFEHVRCSNSSQHYCAAGVGVDVLCQSLSYWKFVFLIADALAETQPCLGHIFPRFEPVDRSHHSPREINCEHGCSKPKHNTVLSLSPYEYNGTLIRLYLLKYQLLVILHSYIM